MANQLGNILNKAKHQLSEAGPCAPAIPGERKDVAAISINSSLNESRQVLQQQKIDTLFVVDEIPTDKNSYILGIILRQHLEHYYRS